MSTQQDHNPYAPSPLAGESFPDAEMNSRRIPTLGLLAATFGGIVLSGSAFGLILAGILSLAETSSVLEVLMLLPLGIVAGGVTAGISGILAVLVTTCLSAPLIPLSKGWLPHQARNYGSICGFLSGSSPILLIGVADPYSWLFALVPGVFGGLGTRFFVRWICSAFSNRPANQSNRTLVEGSANNVT